MPADQGYLKVGSAEGDSASAGAWSVPHRREEVMRLRRTTRDEKAEVSPGRAFSEEEVMRRRRTTREENGV